MLARLNTNAGFPNVFSNFLNEDFWNDWESTPRRSVPAVNVVEDDKAFNIEVAAPGLAKDDINIDLEDNVLTISSEKEDKKEENDKNYTRKEFCYTSFKRSFMLPENVNGDKIEANYKDGITTVKVPKVEEKKLSKKIKIS